MDHVCMQGSTSQTCVHNSLVRIMMMMLPSRIIRKQMNSDTVRFPIQALVTWGYGSGTRTSSTRDQTTACMLSETSNAQKRGGRERRATNIEVTMTCTRLSCTRSWKLSILSPEPIQVLTSTCAHACCSSFGAELHIRFSSFWLYCNMHMKFSRFWQSQRSGMFQSTTKFQELEH
jgi:hypothetical protein